MEIALRLRRGLNLIIGDIGSGKTTLARVLLQNFADEDQFQFFLILDPVFRSEFQFLKYLVDILGASPRGRSTLDYRNALESFLLQAGVVEGKVVVLVIDEGQKLTPGKITLMYHHALESLIMRERTLVEKDLIQELIASEVT